MSLNFPSNYIKQSKNQIFVDQSDKNYQQNFKIAVFHDITWTFMSS